MAATALLTGSALLSLPDGNEHNLFNVAMIFISIPAGGFILSNPLGGMSTSWRPRLRAAAAFALFLPGALFVVATYRCLEVPIMFRGTELVKKQDDSGAAEAYEWIKEYTPRNAVFVLDLESEPRPICNVSDLPAFTRRAVYVDRRTYLTTPYADYRARTELSQRIARALPLSPSDVEIISKMTRPIYLISYKADDAPTVASLSQLYGTPVFASRKVGIFLLNLAQDQVDFSAR